MVQLSEKQIDQIADEIEQGLDCYIHKETGEIISIPDEQSWDLECDDEVTDDLFENIEKDRESFILIEPIDSHESFRIMRDFTYTIDDEEVCRTLQTSLERPKPFANFRFDLDNYPDYKTKWYEYKHKVYVEHVKLMLKFVSGVKK
jgi:hypothetical protein